MRPRLVAFNLTRWVEDNRHLLVPPVGNKMVYSGDNFLVMMVAGPNSRTDYHVEDGEEWFYQLDGAMTLKVVDPTSDDFYDVRIEKGDTFLLPPRWPHSPQRDPGSLGLVVERPRTTNEQDTLRWYCQQCRSVLYQETFQCVDLAKDLPPIIERYFLGPEQRRTCDSCGWVENPQPNP